MSVKTLTVLCTVSLILATFSHSQTLPTQSRTAKIWSDETTDENGDVSRDGRFLSFNNWATSDLAIRDLQTGTNRIITHKTSMEGGQYPGNSFFSPDGKQIAYGWYTESGIQLRIVSVEGGAPTIIKSDKAIAELQGWARDGRKLLVVQRSSNEQNGDIGFLNITDGVFQKLGEVRPSSVARLSPDGSRIILSELSETDPTQTDLRTIFTNGKSLSFLTGPAQDHDPAWSPDGNTIYFLSDRDERASLWMATRTGSISRIGDIPDGDARIIGVSENGSILVGAEDIGGTNCFVGSVNWATGDVSNIQKIANPPLRGARRAVFSNDGKRITFLRRPRGFRVLPGWQIPVVQNLADGRQRAYPTTQTVRDEPVWTAQDRSLLFTMLPGLGVGESSSRKWRFVELDLVTGKYHDVAQTSEAGQVRMAGLNDRELFYMLNGSPSGQIIGLQINGGTRRELFRNANAIGDAALTPDASQLAFTSRQADGKTALQVVDLSTSAPRTIGVMQPIGGAQLIWFPDGQSVIASGRINGQAGVWRFYLDGRPPMRLNMDASEITEIRVSPDAQRIAFTRRAQANREVWSFVPPKK